MNKTETKINTKDPYITINDNPLKNIITSYSRIIYLPRESKMVFYKAVYKHVQYQILVWDFKNDTLTTCKNGKKYRYDVCIKNTVYECKQPHDSTILHSEKKEYLFFKQYSFILCKQLIPYPKIEHVQYTYNTISQHHLFLIGECHEKNEDVLQLNTIISLFVKYFKILEQKEIRVEFFIELSYNETDRLNLIKNVQKQNPNRVLIYNTLYNTFKDSLYIRLHYSDIRYNTDVRFIMDFKKMYTDSKLLNTLYDISFLFNMYSYINLYILPILHPFFPEGKSKTKKQFDKMNDIDTFHTIYINEFENEYALFLNTFTFLKQLFLKKKDIFLLSDTDHSFLNSFYSTLEHGDYIITTISRKLMDFYILGRILKQNNFYNIFYGGAIHSTYLNYLLTTYYNYNTKLYKKFVFPF